SRLEAVTRCLGGARVRAHSDVHADEAGGCGQRRANEESDRRSPAELVVEADEEERDDGDGGDRHVLALEVAARPFLYGTGDLADALVPGREPQQPDGQHEPVDDRDRRADEREQHRVVVEEAGYRHRSTPSQSHAPSVLGAAGFYHKRPFRAAGLRVRASCLTLLGWRAPLTHAPWRPRQLERRKRTDEVGMDRVDVLVREIQELREAGRAKDAPATAPHP